MRMSPSASTTSRAAAATRMPRWNPAEDKQLLKDVEKLAANHRSGSTQLALRACRILGALRPMTNAVPRRTYLRAAARAVASSQPSMAAVWNTCHAWLRCVEAGGTPQAAAWQVARQLEKAQQAVAARAAALISRGCAVATHSSSSTVLAALLAATRQGRRFRLLCSEGRPQMEGRTLARTLAAHRVPVDLLTDAGLLAAISEADLALLGCDAIFPDGFLNKTGTAALVRLARDHSVPVYVLADSFKFVPRRLAASILIREEDPAEVWRTRQPLVRVRNFYFERVPLAGCTGVVTETGVWPPARAVHQVRRSEPASQTGLCSKPGRAPKMGEVCRCA